MKHNKNKNISLKNCRNKSKLVIISRSHTAGGATDHMLYITEAAIRAVSTAECVLQVPQVFVLFQITQ